MERIKIIIKKLRGNIKVTFVQKKKKKKEQGTYSSPTATGNSARRQSLAIPPLRIFPNWEESSSELSPN